MKVIDLSLPLYTGMPVYPGDPEVKIENIQTVAQHGWNMRRIEVSSHDGTHVNTPFHAFNDGKKLDEYKIEDFFGPAEIYTGVLLPHTGVIFRDQKLTKEIFEEIKKVHPRFVGVGYALETEEELEIERGLLREGILLYERLCNLDQLPNNFIFYGVPLNIKEGDGSPVRAFAVIE